MDGDTTLVRVDFWIRVSNVRLNSNVTTAMKFIISAIPVSSRVTFAVASIILLIARLKKSLHEICSQLGKEYLKDPEKSESTSESDEYDDEKKSADPEITFAHNLHSNTFVNCFSKENLKLRI